MRKIVVIFWSGTGNTKKMAEAVYASAQASNIEVSLLRVEDARLEHVTSADAVAFGCPSMGAEVLEEEYMEPFIESVEKIAHNGKPLALFGSYDWGDGEWMREWQARMEKCAFRLVDDGLIVRNAPSAGGLAMCAELGRKIGASIRDVRR
ncbi:MAG: Flavodoxin [Firmicutes bacterium]|nr:Flavodoxin [Bacillota bacterium]